MSLRISSLTSMFDNDLFDHGHMPDAIQMLDTACNLACMAFRSSGLFASHNIPANGRAGADTCSRRTSEQICLIVSVQAMPVGAT